MYRIAIIMLFCVGANYSLEKCNKECGNYIQLNSTIPNLMMFKKAVNISVSAYEKTIMVKILKRKVYTHQINVGFTYTSTSALRDESMLPEEKEAKEWVLRDSCQIGSVCIPYGDCYGGGIIHCTGMGTNPKWVKSREFTFRGAFWSHARESTCTQDWECSIREKRVDVFVDEYKMPYIKPGMERIYLHLSMPMYIRESDFGIWIDTRPKKYVKQTQANCVTVKDDGTLYCEYHSNRAGSKMLMFTKQKSCVSSENRAFCIGKSEIERLNEENKSEYASINDLKKMKNIVFAHIGFQNYNNLIIEQNLYKIRHFLNGIIMSSARFNPFIIKDTMNRNAIVRKVNGYLEYCSCHDKDEEKSCVHGEKVSGGPVKCKESLEKIENSTQIDLLKFFQEEIIFPENIELKGVETNIYEDDREKEGEKHTEWKSKISDGNGVSWSIGSLPGFSIFTSLSSSLTYINTLVIIFLVIRH